MQKVTEPTIKPFETLTKEQAQRAASRSVRHVVAWLEAERIVAGSTLGLFDIYRAVQDGIMSEWARAQENKKSRRLPRRRRLRACR